MNVTARAALASALLACAACGSGGDGSPSSAGPVGPTGPTGPVSADVWRPSSAAPIHWHWQLSGVFDVARDVPLLPNRTVYDLDGQETSADTVKALHDRGAKVICYLDAGGWEKSRPDAGSYPQAVIGKEMKDWPGIYWLDIRRQDVLLPLLEKRIQEWCVAKGFDAVEPDDTEVYGNDSGFPISQGDNDAFNKAVAALVHRLGLSVGLKNNNDRAPALAADFDWALTEQCWENEECEKLYTGFASQGKAVFNVEYATAPDCAQANAWHLNAVQRDGDVVGPRDAAYHYAPCVKDDVNHW